MSREVQAPNAKIASFLMRGLADIPILQLLNYITTPMLVKRIGYILIIRSRAYKPISFLAPALMLACIFLVALVPSITESYKFQEPALRTKVSTVHPLNNTNSTLLYEEVHPGIGLAVVGGRLSGESVLLVSRCGSTSGEVFENVRQSILRDNELNRKLLAKNVGFVCYNSTSSMHSFMKHQTGLDLKSSQQLQNELGIVRNALVLELEPQSRKTRVYFNMYSPQSELHVDLDYYQAIKQLLLQVGLGKWQPCRQIQQTKFLSAIVRSTNRKWWSFALKHFLCQLHEVTRTGKIKESVWPQEEESDNINYIFQENGIQAATVEISYHQANQSAIVQQVSRLGLSFLEEFVVLQDHLHSSSTFYLPLSQSEYVPLKALLIPGLAYLIVAASYLIIKAIKILNAIAQPQTEDKASTNLHEGKAQQPSTIKLNPIIVLLLLALHSALVEFYFNRTLYFSLLLACLTRRTLMRKPLPAAQKQLIRTLLAGVSIFLCQYCAIFCFPYSLLLILLTNILCFTSQGASAAILIMGILGLMHFGQMGVVELTQELLSLSPFAQVVTWPILLWVLVV